MAKTSITVYLLVAVTVATILISTLVLPATCKALHTKRSPANYCSPATPCGWHVYNKNDRRPLYIVTTPCECPENLKCVRDHDDISIAAWVHRCRRDGLELDRAGSSQQVH